MRVRVGVVDVVLWVGRCGTSGRLLTRLKGGAALRPAGARGSGGPGGSRDTWPSARGLGCSNAGRVLQGVVFAFLAAFSTGYRPAIQGGTCCPSAVAVGPPTIIGGANSLCGTGAIQKCIHRCLEGR